MTTNQTHDDNSIDLLARRAGAEVRQPAPEGMVTGIRRARRRQQTTRGIIGVTGALVAVAALALATRPSQPTTPIIDPAAPTLVGAPNPPPATTIAGTPPDTAVPLPSATTGEPATTTAPSPIVPLTGSDADGIPDGIYVYADDTLTSQNVLDPTTFEIRETRPAGNAYVDPPTEAISASGLITYTLQVFGEVDYDACRQTHNRVAGAPATGLPEWMSDLTVSSNGKVGAVASAVCSPDQTFDESLRPTKPLDIEVSVFDADRPELPARSITVVDATQESGPGLSLSDDGSFLIVSTREYLSGEGYASVMIRIYDTASGRVVVDHAPNTAFDMPHGDCSTWPGEPRFVGATAVAYAALCSDAIYVVIRELVTGETIDVVATEYANRTYEDMIGASLTVDQATYTTPGQAWFMLCAERYTVLGDVTVNNAPGSNPCWLGHGGDELRPIPMPFGFSASFKPFD